MKPEERRAQIERVKTAYDNGWPILKIAKYADLSSQEVAEIVQGKHDDWPKGAA